MWIQLMKAGKPLQDMALHKTKKKKMNKKKKKKWKSNIKASKHKRCLSVFNITVWTKSCLELLIKGQDFFLEKQKNAQTFIWILTL